ncbi:hypothetical protein [Streptomyces sp. NPDC101237]|uniref:hypothetical protein n=1 Tax=Streptomyces sp. NPDC101237 TaxID=3366139 RepID=UPI003827FB9C
MTYALAAAVLGILAVVFPPAAPVLGVLAALITIIGAGIRFVAQNASARGQSANYEREFRVRPPFARDLVVRLAVPYGRTVGDAESSKNKPAPRHARRLGDQPTRGCCRNPPY